MRAHVHSGRPNTHMCTLSQLKHAHECMHPCTARVHTQAYIHWHTQTHTHEYTHLLTHTRKRTHARIQVLSDNSALREAVADGQVTVSRYMTCMRDALCKCKCVVQVQMRFASASGSALCKCFVQVQMHCASANALCKCMRCASASACIL